MAYFMQAPGLHGPGYWLAGSPVSCLQLEADAGTVAFLHEIDYNEISKTSKITHFEILVIKGSINDYK